MIASHCHIYCLWHDLAKFRTDLTWALSSQIGLKSMPAMVARFRSSNSTAGSFRTSSAAFLLILYRLIQGIRGWPNLLVLCTASDIYCQSFVSCPRIPCKDPIFKPSRVEEILGLEAVLCTFLAPYKGPQLQGRVISPAACHPAPLVCVDPAISPYVQEI
jgi:hypothetical protein